MVSTSVMRTLWADYRCLNERPSSMRKPITMFGRNAGYAAAPAYDWFKAAEMALTANGYSDVKSIWVPRNCPTGISGKTCQADGTNCSLHNYGIAFDVDPYGYGNPHFMKPFGQGWSFSNCKLTEQQVRAVEAIRNTHGEVMSRWLGWAIGDTMHFEIQVSPSRTEVDWTTVPMTSTPIEEMPQLPLEHGMQSEDVRSLQDRLNRAYKVGLKEDAVYGDTTAAAIAGSPLPSYTGDKSPDITSGRRVNANMWNGLFEDWVKSLGVQGPAGPTGPPGPAGPAAKLVIQGEQTIG